MNKILLCIGGLLMGFSLSAQSLDQVKFTGKAELLIELGHRFSSNYLTISHHQYRMAFTEKFPYIGNLDETISERDKFHGHKWSIDILPDYDDDGGLVTPIGFDYQGGFYYNKVLTDEYGEHLSMINYISKGYILYEDIIPRMENYSGLQSGTISKNERYMIISTQGAFSHGKDDLYVIEYKNDRWAHFINLGGVVNTKYQEVTPFLALDNKTLFFASDRKGGKGSYDIYVTKRLDNSWKKWSKPINVSEVNTLASETSFCFIDTDPYAYFIRSHASDVYGDIMEIPIQLNIIEDSTYVEIEEEIEGSYFKVVDGSTEESISAQLVLVDNLSQLDAENGIFDAENITSKTLIFKSEGYFSSKLKLGDELPGGENIIYLEPLTIGSSITLENVLFERASPKILASSYDELDLLTEVMNENPNLKIRLKGHTDGKGNPRSNLELSQKRVDAVSEYMRKKGINKKRISGIGYGGKFPIASNETEETRRLNRRVEFEVVE